MKKIFLYLMLLLTVAVSCKKESALNVDITKSNLDTYTKGTLDKWLEDNFLNPYNMEILYRFDRYQAKIDKEIAPVMEDKVQPLMEGVQQIFIQPYLDVTSKAFLLPVLPKEIALFGSGEYSDDQITLGTADAGRQINLYEVNSYDKNDVLSIMGTQERPAAFHTMHHEFAHILHQNVPVPPEYEAISSNYIGSSWVGSGNSAATAKSLGFITRYARNNKDEDFAEMISTLLVEGQDHFDAYVNTATDATAITKLRKKEQVVVDYFKAAHGIDFRRLQARVRTAIETYAPVAIVPVPTRLSQGSYKGVTIDKSAASQSSAFVTAYNSAVTNVGAVNGIPINPTVELVFTNPAVNRTDMILKFTGSTFAFWYNLTATVTTGNSGTIRLVAAPQGAATQYANGTFIQAQMKPILDYFTTKTFRANWIEGLFPGSRSTLLGFFDTSNSQLGFYGNVQR
ncbi:substrate import-associated zinc metallohydrolase lipoprotein [Pedobacter africanus]|uniref:Substrate import-associated zinc metallohydrolase lipoprotein n=1 Tax=Pedobacter africanus TaxID=151894 RepID=A0ACC6KXA4_9SPHI|nr:substrate import-associated zinc metallohydrolase lipoprotein [Pedobacter africanus]MDR6783889.1 substrate import-associated zinc metallohydrolase lipoprotein [Pedobacter africanus]